MNNNNNNLNVAGSLEATMANLMQAGANVPNQQTVTESGTISLQQAITQGQSNNTVQATSPGQVLPIVEEPHSLNAIPQATPLEGLVNVSNTQSLTQPAQAHPVVAGVEITPELASLLNYDYAKLFNEQFLGQPGTLVSSFAGIQPVVPASAAITTGELSQSVAPFVEEGKTIAAIVKQTSDKLSTHQALMYLGVNGYGQSITMLNPLTYSCADITTEAKLMSGFFVELLSRNPEDLKSLLEGYGLHVVIENIGENTEFESEERIIKIFSNSDETVPMFYIFDNETDEWAVNYSTKSGLTQNLLSSLHKTIEHYISLPVQVKNTRLERIVSAVLMSPELTEPITVFATSIEEFITKVDALHLDDRIRVINGRILNDVLVDVTLIEFLEKLVIEQEALKIRFMDYRIAKDGLRIVVENIRAVDGSTGEFVPNPAHEILQSFSYFLDPDSIDDPAKVETFWRMEEENPGAHEITATDIYEVAKSKGMKIID